MHILPIVSSSTPMADWFAGMNQLYHIVQTQTALIQTLQERIAVLESQAHIVRPVEPVHEALREAPVAKKLKTVRKPKSTAATTAATAAASTGTKRGRKPNTDCNLTTMLREGEQIIARIPLGDRAFDEHAVHFREGTFVLEDGQTTFDHPTTMVSALAKILEDIGERSTECSKSLNGWILCSVSRDGKRIPLEQLKHQSVTTTMEQPASVDVETESSDGEL